MLKQKTLNKVEGFRGVERIRTAVDGVADHCLATRPRHLIEGANVEKI